MSTFHNQFQSIPDVSPYTFSHLTSCITQRKCQITQVQWVANAISCWHYQIELVLGSFKKKTQWSQTVIWHTKERSAGYNYETIVCWQTDWQANWLFQYCKYIKVQCEELAVTQGLLCIAVLGSSERRTNVHILPAKTKKRENKTI